MSASSIGQSPIPKLLVTSSIGRQGDSEQALAELLGGPEGDLRPRKLAIEPAAEAFVVPPEGLDPQEPLFGLPGIDPGGEAEALSGDQAAVALAVVGAAAMAADDALVGGGHGRLLGPPLGGGGHDG